VQVPYALPCLIPSRRVRSAEMIEVDVYYFYWLSISVTLMERIKPGIALAAVIKELGYARVALGGLKEGTELAKAFPQTAESAQEMLRIINSVLPEVGTELTYEQWSREFTEFEAQRIRVLCTHLPGCLRTEGQHGYVLKLEDQRCLSSYNLNENIENCFQKGAWSVIGDDAKDEFVECGKCLAMERYTASGFHSLRGVECVIRQYIVKLTGSLPKKRDWGSYIQTLRDNGADAKAIAVIDNIRTLDRNPLMHPEDWLDVDESVSIFMISQTAITRLASALAKLPPKGVPTP
jgi:hypothetical protein